MTVDRLARTRIEVERRAGEPFDEEPEATSALARGLRAHDRRELLHRHRFRERCDDLQVHPLPLEGELQVPGEGIRRCMSRSTLGLGREKRARLVNSVRYS